MKKFKCIVLVDDDFNTASEGKRFLDEMKIAESVSAFSNGQEALDFIKQSSGEKEYPDVIFIDSGGAFKFLKNFQKSYTSPKQRTKIFILTVSEDITDTQKAKDFNINGYLVKPLTKEKIIDSLLKGLF